jgi:hypothetical protein
MRSKEEGSSTSSRRAMKEESEFPGGTWVTCIYETLLILGKRAGESFRDKEPWGEKESAVSSFFKPNRLHRDG